MIHIDVLTEFANMELIPEQNRFIGSSFGGLGWGGYILPRDRILKKMHDFIVDGRAKFTIVSSPAATGKTSLVLLFLEQLASSDYLKFHFQCCGKEPFAMLESIGLRRRMGDLRWSMPESWTTKGVVIVLDDAHCIYQYADFWAALMKGTPRLPPNVCFIIAATYLYSGVGSNVEFGSILTRVKRGDLILTDDESMDVLLHYLPDCLRNCHTLLNRIVTESQGNIGAILKVAEYLTTKVKNHPRLPKPIDEATPMEWYLHSDLMILMERVFSSKRNYDDIETRYILTDCIRDKRKSLHGGLSTQRKNALHLLLECGVLVSEYNQADLYSNLPSANLVFASVLTKRYFMNMIYSDRALKNPDSLLQLIKLTIPLLQSSILKQSVTDVSDFPKEATLQHVFMVALAANTTASTGICPELSHIYPDTADKTTSSINGEIDFYLNGDLRWGIELLISGKGIKKHMDSLRTNNRSYVNLKMRDWIVIDLLRGPVSNLVQRHDNKLSVFFAKDFSSCDCIFGTDFPSFELKLKA